jgi:hypothetical protein
MKRCQDHGNSYNGKHLVGSGFQLRGLVHRHHIGKHCGTQVDMVLEKEPRWNLRVVLICISLMIKDVEHFFKWRRQNLTNQAIHNCQFPFISVIGNMILAVGNI